MTPDPDPDTNETPPQPGTEPARSQGEPVVPEGQPAQKKVYVGAGVSWAIIFGALLIVAVAVLGALNTAPVPLNLIFWKGDVPLISIILGVAAVTVVIDELVGLIFRLRRRRRLRQRNKLKELEKGAR
ncbi:hypothetical protein BMS3Abin02_01783 [bacterium BMS3Abin02]|nr:hypothetical protein BMS3Abin02_01783 [bacterium BMS3Abin02]GBE22835.1 hypothetical protein BMS3Bbin01_02212 [bacterium BMS3Bbin01]